MAVRLQKLLAQAGYGSRRNCETLIASGRVFVNGKKADFDTVLSNGDQIGLAPATGGM